MEATLWQRLDEIITRTVRPMAERCDEESLFCGESVRALADAGFMGLPYPPEQGGRGSSYESYVRCVERLSKACPSVGVTYATHVGLAQGRRSIWQRRGAWHRNMNVLYRAELRENERRKI